MKIKENKTTWFWVTGNTNKGFKVVTKRPRTKHINEPHSTMKGAQVWIANEWCGVNG